MGVPKPYGANDGASRYYRRGGIFYGRNNTYRWNVAQCAADRWSVAGSVDFDAADSGANGAGSAAKERR